jgi:hypothetical protein
MAEPRLAVYCGGSRGHFSALTKGGKSLSAPHQWPVNVSSADAVVSDAASERSKGELEGGR